jgi:Domain of unknown function (DUF4277)
MHRSYCKEVLDHLGLVAGMVDALSLGDVLERARQHHPETRRVTMGSAVHAMVRTGLGMVNPLLDVGAPGGGRSRSPAGCHRWRLAQHGMRGSSAQRCRPAQQRGDKSWPKPRAAAAQALPQRCSTTCAWAADAQPALTTVAHGWQVAALQQRPLSASPRDSWWGRPGPGTVPVPVVSPRTGAWTASLRRLVACVSPTNSTSPDALSAPAGGGSRPAAWGTRSSILASSTLGGLLPLSSETRAEPGVADGHDRVLAAGGRLGVSPPQGPQGP